MGQALRDINLVSTINYNTIVVVPEISLGGDQCRDRAVYYVSCGMDQYRSA